MRQIIFLLLLSLSMRLSAADIQVNGTLNLHDLFSVDADLAHGIKGAINPNGQIEVKMYDNTTATLIYHAILTQTSTTYKCIDRQYSKSELGLGAAYFPNKWNSGDLRTSAFSIARKLYDSKGPVIYNILSSKLDVRISFHTTNAQIEAVKIPGIGELDANGGNRYFHPNHFCYNISNSQTLPYKAWMGMKQPKVSKGADFVIAAHRGFWGDNLGNSNPENSIGAFEAAKQFTDVLETDVTYTGDRKLVMSHDYSLHRLSNYEGDKNDFLFDMDSSILDNLFLRKRNMTVSDSKYLLFEDVVDAIVRLGLVLKVDIKDIRAKYKNGVCIANCEYDPKTHGEVAAKKVKDSWMGIFAKCISIAAKKNALQYIAFKSPYTFNELKEYVSEDTLNRVLFMPVIQPGRKDFLEFTDAWIEQGGNKVIAYETNFKNPSDMYLKPIDRGGVHYVNLLEYVYKRTGLRPGCYPEEAMGPKGVVSRWADWQMKDLRKDFRGDHLWLMSVPYGNIMVLTTDRPDIWNSITQIYNSKKK